MLHKGQDSPGNHDIVVGCNKTYREEQKEKEALQVAPDFPGVEMHTGHAPTFEQRKQVGKNTQADEYIQAAQMWREVRCFKNEHARQGQNIGASIRNGIQSGSKFGFHPVAASYPAIQNVGNQVDDE